jgi:hypothetical protein
MTLNDALNRPGASRLWGRVVIGLAAAAVAVLGCVAPPRAGASVDDFALNGTFRATSNGEWAQTNDSYHDEQTIRSVWTIVSECSDAYHCSGTVSSDQGWTAPINKASQSWTVERHLPNWQTCDDGSVAAGRQLYRFWRVDEAGNYDLGNQSSVFAGEDKTVGISGSCGVSRELAIRMPFRLEKID